MCVSGLCQWAGWTFSFLGFWSGCTLTGPSAQHPPGRGWRGRVFGSVLAAPEGRGGGRGVGYSPDAWPAAHAGPQPRPPVDPLHPRPLPTAAAAQSALALIGSGGGQSAPGCPAHSGPVSAPLCWGQGLGRRRPRPPRAARGMGSRRPRALGRPATDRVGV